MPYSLLTPGQTVFGADALESCREALCSFGKKPLIVTSSGMDKMPAFTKLTAMLGDTPHAVFTDIPAEPDDAMVLAGTAAYRQAGCDCVIGIGGGSALDSAKAIAASSVLPNDICSYAGQEIVADVPPLALIPTTAGTGSEATKFIVITQSGTNAKLLLKGDVLLPKLAIVDYTLTASMPAKLTAYTGMDTLTHAVEAYTSKKANPLCDPYAIDAVKRCFESLPTAYHDGGSLKDRESMALAAFEAGVCICNASVTIVHGMSRPIGAKFHVPHGLSNAMLLAPCLAFAAEGAPERFARLSRAVGFATDAQPDAEAAQALIDKLKQISKVLEIPTPGEYGIAKEDFLGMAGQMAAEALQSGSPANTLRPVTSADIVSIYQSLY